MFSAGQNRSMEKCFAKYLKILILKFKYDKINNSAFSIHYFITFKILKMVIINIFIHNIIVYYRCFVGQQLLEVLG